MKCSDTEKICESNDMLSPLFSITLILASTVLSCVFLCFYKHCWHVFVKCSFCNCIGKVRRKELSHWCCDNCQQINNFSEVERKICINEHNNNEKKDVSNDFNKANETFTVLHPENSLMAAFQDANKQCNSTKAIYKKLLKENLEMQMELLSTKKKLYDTMNQVKSMEKSLFNATEMASKSCLDNRPYNSDILSKKSSNIKRRTSFFSSTLIHPMEELKEKYKKKEDTILKNFGTKITGLQSQIRLLKDMHEKEVKILGDKFMKKNEIISQLDNLNQEIVKIYDATRHDEDKNFDTA